MRILFLGDIVGRPGRQAVKDNLTAIREAENIDLAFANAENASGGFGLSANNAKALFSYGLDGLTSGNHIWKFKNLWNMLENDNRLTRAHNYPDSNPGTGVRIIETDGLPPVALVNLQGRVFMQPIDCPFAAAEAALEAIPDEVTIRIVDFHAEATGEKAAMAHFLDGRVSAVLGTHTHVQTNDAAILSSGTAFMTDLGMSGAAGSCLGVKHEDVLQRYLTGLPRALEVPAANGILQGAIFDIEDTTGQAVAITPFRHE